MSYSKPKCEKGSKLMRTRCECKKTAKKTAKKRVIKKDAYQEHWALVRGQYSHNIPSKNQLKVRRKRIDEAYKLYDKIKKLDKTVPPPKKWRYPPEYCYNVQLQNMIKDLTKELKGLELDKKEAKEKEMELEYNLV